MKWRVLIRARAETDLREAQDWYENQRTGLGKEFLVDIGVAMQLLARDPERRPEYYRGFRRGLTCRFPYKLFYRLEGDRVIVFRVLHASRDHARLLPRER